MLNHLQSREDWNNKSLGAKGFTLIELLVVIIILGILAGVAIFAINGIDDDANKKSCENEKDTVEVAIAAFQTRSATGALPTSLADLRGANGNLAKDPKYWTVSNTGAPTRLPASLSLVSQADCG